MIDEKMFERIFTSYNSEIQSACEQGLMYVKSPKDYEMLVTDARKRWETKAISGKLPEVYFNELTTLEEFEKIFVIAVDICDEFIPVSFFNVIEKCNATSFVERVAFEEDDFEAKVVAIKIIGKLKKKSLNKQLINEIYKSDEELIKEVAREALVDIGSLAINSIKEHLNECDTLDGDDFHLIIALVEIDKSNKSDEVYKSLKEFFLKSTDKAIASRCISDYNDQRAIPFLRGFLSKNRENLEQSEELEIRSAIKILGGNEEDI